MVRNTQWGVLLLVGGGFALADACGVSTHWLNVINHSLLIVCIPWLCYSSYFVTTVSPSEIRSVWDDWWSIGRRKVTSWVAGSVAGGVFGSSSNRTNHQYSYCQSNSAHSCRIGECGLPLPPPAPAPPLLIAVTIFISSCLSSLPSSSSSSYAPSPSHGDRCVNYFLIETLVLQANKSDLNPLHLMLPTTIAASFSFMLPVATPGNAIVMSCGRLRIIDMVCGLMSSIHTCWIVHVESRSIENIQKGGCQCVLNSTESVKKLFSAINIQESVCS